MAQHNDRGRWGEDVAAAYLVAHGYAIRETNWRHHHYEIDIVAMMGDRVVIAEVKTRADRFVDPADAVTPAKQRRLVSAANAYMSYCALPHEVQFDIVVVTGTPENYEIEHIPDAFYPRIKKY